jgi:alpha-tubulin suppressor-like RCC1 family protein
VVVLHRTWALFGCAFILGACSRSSQSGGAQASPSAKPATGCVKQLVGNSGFSCALTARGAVWCWGDPGRMSILAEPGQLREWEPWRVASLPASPTKIFVDEDDSVCATSRDANLWCVAGNGRGQLRFPPGEGYSRTALQHPDLHDVRQVIFGGRCMVGAESLSCWSAHDYTVTPVTSFPVPVAELVGGEEFACVRLQDGSVWCRGSHLRSQIGYVPGPADPAGPNPWVLPVFVRLPELREVKQLASSGRHTCALDRDGLVWCWGENERGQIGKGDLSRCQFDGKNFVCSPEEGRRPTLVKGLPPAESIALGATTSCAVTGDGYVWCWGSLPEPTPKPVNIPIPEPVASVIEGGAPSCFLYRDGRVGCWRYGDRRRGGPHEMKLDCAAK